MSMSYDGVFFSTPEMTAIFSPSAQLRAMMRFEWALSCALEKAGLAERGSGSALEGLLNAQFVDVEALTREAIDAGNIAIPFIRQLTMAVKRTNDAASRTVHLGATSQDVLDSALILQMREALREIGARIDRLSDALTSQIHTHAGTLMLGRTWLQPGPPTTLGLKLAGTLAALRRHRARIDAAAERALVLQFGGAVGTLASLGSSAAQVSTELARILELQEPDIPWHTQRDNLVEVAQVLALLVGSLGKLAKDVALLMQAEMGEVFEPLEEGRGGSSTMPHKRNPVACAAVLAAAARIPGLVSTLLSAMPQEHERGLGLWQAEWETIPEVFCLTAAALRRSAEIAEGLEVDAKRMRKNFEDLRGMALSEAVSAALALKTGRATAHELLRKATSEVMATGQPLESVLNGMPEVRLHLNSDEIQRLLQPEEYLGSAQRFIDRVLRGSNADR
jgi:3-carboxy-cis,cis-muconate cycloisomerase